MFCTHTILKDTAYNFPRRNFISDLAGGPYLLHLNSQALYVRTTAFKELSLRADISFFYNRIIFLPFVPVVRVCVFCFFVFVLFLPVVLEKTNPRGH